MKTISPETAGFSSERLAEIDRVFQAHVGQNKTTGLITMVARRGQIVHQRAHGVLNVDTGQPVPLDTIFRIASMTKPITSVAVMMLYEEGHFDLDTPIATFIPAFKEIPVFKEKPVFKEPPMQVEKGATDLLTEPLKSDMTIRHLFTQTSGLEGYFEDDGTLIEQLYHQELVKLERAGVPLTLANMVDAVATVPLAWQPGTQWGYGLGLDVLAYLVERVSGVPYAQFLQERIFQPLGMIDTAYHIPPEKVHRLARVHHYSPVEERLNLREFSWMDVPTQAPSYVEGGNLLLSTVNDYAWFAQMLLNRGELDGVRLLKPETVDLIASNHVEQSVLHNGFRDVADGYGFGLGVRVRMDDTCSAAVGAKGEYGWGGLYNTVFWIDPQHDLFGLLMMQQLGFSLAQEFKALVYEALL